MGCNSLDIEAYDATKEAVAADPENGKGSFETVTEWQDEPSAFPAAERRNRCPSACATVVSQGGGCATGVPSDTWLTRSASPR